MTEEERSRHRIALQNLQMDQKFEPIIKMQRENVELQHKKTVAEQKAVAVLSKKLSNIPRSFEDTALNKSLTTLTQFPDISRLVSSVVVGISGAVVMFPAPIGAVVMIAGFVVGFGVGHSAHQWIAHQHGADTPENRSRERMHLMFKIEELNDVCEPLRHCLNHLQALSNDADIPVSFWLKCNRELENTIKVQKVYKKHSASLLAQWKELSKPDLAVQKSIENLKQFMQQRGLTVPVAPSETIAVAVEPQVEPAPIVNRFKL